ncbi:replication endonuclease, partial [Klebsiella oxytoca]|nr:replication endonuclease [Klebsiella oxytoca]HBV8119735.1 replication endonuclease [Klebsiella oxytoca]
PGLDLSKPLSRSERRKLTARLREKTRVTRRDFVHGTDKQSAAIDRTIDEIQLTTGETISRGEALHLMAGGKSCINDKWCRGSSTGEIFPAAPSHRAQARQILNRVAGLASVTKLRL